MSKDILRLAAILLVICGIAAACVGTAHDQTAPLIEARKADAVREGYKQVLPDAGQLTDEPAAGKHIVAVKRSETDGQTNGYIYTVNPDGYSGKVVIMLGIEYPSARISGVKILQQNETPGLGAKCTEPAFIDQFLGKELSHDLTVSKNASQPQEIQAITASTITSKAVVKGINSARKHYQEHFGVSKAACRERSVTMLPEFTKGIIRENPLFVQLLGVCPALATTSSLTNALGMGAAFTAVLIGSNLIISALKKFIPANIRIPAYIVVIASLVTVTEMLMNAYVPAIYESLGIFIPLIVVNCIILGRAEAFASKNGLWLSFQDAVGMGIGFTLALSAIGACREFFGAGTLLGHAVALPGTQPVLLLILPAGAFLTMGLLFGALNYIKARREVNHGQ